MSLLQNSARRVWMQAVHAGQVCPREIQHPDHSWSAPSVSRRRVAPAFGDADARVRLRYKLVLRRFMTCDVRALSEAAMLPIKLSGLAVRMR